MCKYCDTDSLKKMHDEVDGILSEDYDDSTEERINDVLADYTVFTLKTWGGNTYFFLDDTYWDEDRFAEWHVPFRHCPMCGRKLAD